MFEAVAPLDQAAPSDIVRAADLEIVEAYVKVIQRDERNEATAYFNELKKLRSGNKDWGVPPPSTQTQQRRTSSQKNGTQASTSIPAAPPVAKSEHMLNDNRWSKVERDSTTHDVVRVARRCTAAMLDMFKELESIRTSTKKLFDGLSVHTPRNVAAPCAVNPSRPMSARSAVSTCNHKMSLLDVQSGSKELYEDIYDAAGRAVDIIRSHVVYTSHILNAHIIAPDAQRTLAQIVKLVQEESAQVELRHHRDAQQRAEDHLNALGVRHLSSATDLLRVVPSAAPEIHSWRAAVASPPEASAEASSVNGGLSKRPSDSPSVVAKAVALERVRQKSRELCDSLQLHLVSSTETPKKEASSPRRPSRPTTAKIRCTPQRSAQVEIQGGLGVDGRAATRSARPSTATSRLGSTATNV